MAGAIANLNEFTICGCVCACASGPCYCERPGVMIPSDDLVEALSRWRSENSANFTRTSNAIAHRGTGDACPGGAVCESLRAAHKHEETLRRGAHSKHQVALGKLADGYASHLQITERSAVAALADVHTFRAITKPQSVSQGTCQNARAGENAGRAMRVTAQHNSTLSRARRARADARYGRESATVIATLPDRKRIPEFLGAHAGSLSTDEMADAFESLRVIMPEHASSPKGVPQSSADSPEALAYEKAHAKYAGRQALYGKYAQRDIIMNSATVKMSNDHLEAWRDIAGGVVAPIKTRGNSESLMPDHSHGISPVVSQGQNFISERDHIRTEVYKRYANPHYLGDREYSLQHTTSEEDLIREMIAIAAVRNRMVYEVMTSAVHLTSIAALERADRHAANEGAQLEELLIEATVR